MQLSANRFYFRWSLRHASSFVLVLLKSHVGESKHEQVVDAINRSRVSCDVCFQYPKQ